MQKNQTKELKNLSYDEERALLRLAKKKDPAATERLTLAFKTLVNNIADAMYGYQLPREDLVSEGNIGLLKAIHAFDLSRETRFSSLAYHYIRSEMQEFIVKNFSLVKCTTTKSKRKLFFSVRSRYTALSNAHPKWSRSQIVQQISADMTIPVDEVIEMAFYMLGADDVYDEIYDEHGTNAGVAALFSQKKNATSDYHQPEKSLVLSQENDAANQLINKLPALLNKKELDIFTSRQLRDKEDALTLKTLAERYSISKERVRQIESKARRILADSVCSAH